MASIIISSSGRPPSAISGTKIPNYDSYRRRLEPLAELEDRLIRLLSSPDEDEATHLPGGWEGYPNGNINTDGWSNGRPAPTIYIPQSRLPHSSPVSPVTASTSYQIVGPTSGSALSPTKSRPKEITVHTTTNWKKAFALGGKSKSPKSAHSGEIEGWWEDPDDPVHALHLCAPSMLELWRDQRVRQRLREKRIRLEESSGL